jgi:hypothetical protein
MFEIYNCIGFFLLCIVCKYLSEFGNNAQVVEIIESVTHIGITPQYDLVIRI